MIRERKTKTPEEAKEYTRGLLKREAERIGIGLDRWILTRGKKNDVRPGPGPRYNIVDYAQGIAANQGTYGQVLGYEVAKGNGGTYKICQHDLAGFVCANGYC